MRSYRLTFLYPELRRLDNCQSLINIVNKKGMHCYIPFFVVIPIRLQPKIVVQVKDQHWYHSICNKLIRMTMTE